jgi:hypothetical protein
MGREGRERWLRDVALLSQFCTIRSRMVEGVEEVLIPLHIVSRFRVML